VFERIEEKHSDELEDEPVDVRRRRSFLTWRSPARFYALTLWIVGIALVVSGRSGGVIAVVLGLVIYALDWYAEHKGEGARTEIPS
jgi:hypothetical protein